MPNPDCVPESPAKLRKQRCSGSMPETQTQVVWGQVQACVILSIFEVDYMLVSTSHLITVYGIPALCSIAVDICLSI